MSAKEPRPAQEALTESERALLDCVSEVVDMGLGPLRMERRDLGGIPGGGCSRVQVDRLLQIIDRLVLALATAQAERDAAVKVVEAFRAFRVNLPHDGTPVEMHAHVLALSAALREGDTALAAYDALRAGKDTS